MKAFFSVTSVSFLNSEEAAKLRFVAGKNTENYRQMGFLDFFFFLTSFLEGNKSC